MINFKKASGEILKRVSKVLLLLLVSCNSGGNVKREIVRDNEMKIIYYENIESNKEYIGKVIKKYPFDSIELKKKDLRSKSLYLVQSKELLSVKYLDDNKDSLPRFGQIEKNNDTLYFTYEFKEAGEFYLEGLIDDAVFLDNYYGDGKSRLLNNLTKLSEKVTVTE